MSKGSGRRPGTVPDGEWERIFGKKPEVSEHDRAVRVLQRIEEGKQDAKPGRDLPGEQGRE